MKTILEKQLLGLMRHLLTTAGGAAVAAGYLDGSQASVVIGALVAILGVGLSIAEKRLHIDE